MPKPTFFNLPEEKRDHIVDVAIEEFAKHGYKGASISRMVSTAGIAKGSFYQYFQDLDDLYCHIVCTYIADKKITTFQNEAGRLEDLSFTEYLRLVFHRQIEDFSEQPLLLKIGVDLMQLVGQPIHRKIMENYKGAYSNYFSSYLQRKVELGEIDPEINIQLLNFMLISLGQYMIHRYTAEDLRQINYGMMDEIVNDLEYILSNGIYNKART